MSAIVGLLACGVSSLFFGSMFVPVRKFQPGDGIVMQFIMCSAIFTIGLGVYFYRGFPQFQPFAVLGGVGWCVGNLTAMPIIDAIGLGLGVLIWGSVNCTVGWAIGRFGLFGTKASIPEHIIMNYAGLLCVVVGGALFSQVKSSTTKSPASSIVKDDEEINVREEIWRFLRWLFSSNNNSPFERRHFSSQDKYRFGNVPTSVQVAQTEAEQHLLGEQQNEGSPVPRTESPNGEVAVNEPAGQTSPLKKKLIGIGLSVIAGLCYGTTFVPTVYIQTNPKKFHNPSKDGVDYVFSNFVGIYLTSITVLIIYIIYKKNKPYVEPQIIGPSLITGLMWAIAQMMWFVANDSLSQAITFPINAMVPGVVATLWSVFYFKEIKGKRNMQLLGIAIGITLLGAALVGMSK